MKLTITFLAIFFLISFVQAQETICVDFDAPSAPSNIHGSGEANNFLLQWDAAVDVPECSGIDYYEIHRDGELIGSSEEISFLDDSVGVGEHEYAVKAIDKVGFEAVAEVILNVGHPITQPTSPATGGGGSGGGGGGGGSVGSVISTENTDEDNSNQGSSNSESGDIGLAIEEEVNSSGQEGGFLSRITGAVTGALQGQTGQAIVVGFIVVVFAASIFVRVKRRRMKNQNL
ncbi:hypothetical protein HY450_00325 [Candidatus Pacearchaeota archaeon]|nr:hypothetical protein [Candidatus Pacearchaeota archaeon]